MAPRGLFILGLAACAGPSEAFKPWSGFLGRVFGSEDSGESQTVLQLAEQSGSEALKSGSEALKSGSQESQTDKLAELAGSEAAQESPIAKKLASGATAETQIAQQPASRAWIQRSVVNDEGASLGNHHGAISVETCQLFCETTDGCKSFAYKPAAGKSDAWCHLKDKCVNDKSSEKSFPVDAFSTFYKKYIKMIWSERTLVADEGAAIAGYESLSLEKCKQKCHADTKCKSVSFGRQWCLLKDKCVTADDRNATNSYIDSIKTYYMPCATSGSATWHQRSFVDVSGGKLAEERLSQKECEVKCDANPLCNSFSHKQDSDTCRLYDKAVTEEETGTVQVSAYHTYYNSC